MSRDTKTAEPQSKMLIVLITYVGVWILKRGQNRSCGKQNELNYKPQEDTNIHNNPPNVQTKHESS